MKVGGELYMVDDDEPRIKNLWCYSTPSDYGSCEIRILYLVHELCAEADV